jgi:hypothetical protein
MASLYYECHITVEPVFDDRLELMKELCKSYKFRVADLLMQKRKADSPARSMYDTFCTGRDKNFRVLESRMELLIRDLQLWNFKVWRYKIEDAIIDSKYKDNLNVLDGLSQDDILSEV